MACMKPPSHLPWTFSPPSAETTYYSSVCTVLGSTNGRLTHYPIPNVHISATPYTLAIPSYPCWIQLSHHTSLEFSERKQGTPYNNNLWLNMNQPVHHLRSNGDPRSSSAARPPPPTATPLSMSLRYGAPRHLPHPHQALRLKTKDVVEALPLPVPLWRPVSIQSQKCGHQHEWRAHM